MLLALLAATLAPAGHALAATEGRFGDLMLDGLARESVWPSESAGYGYTVVCGLDVEATLAVRAEPNASAAVTTRLERFTTVEVDTRARRNGWVRVVGADRSFETDGTRRAYTSLLVEGWASDAFLCAYRDD